MNGALRRLLAAWPGMPGLALVLLAVIDGAKRW